MSRRFVTLLIASGGVLAGLVVAAVVAVPYVALMPGPTFNALGSQGGRALVQITGHTTYAATGHLNLVTVSYTGGPGTDFNVFSALRAWLTPNDAVVPASEIYAPGQSQQQVVQQDTQQMLGSQQDATAAALCYLNIGFTTVDTVSATVKGYAANGVLRRGDVITAVDGTPVDCHHSVVDMIRNRRPGAPVAITVSRAGVTKTFTLATKPVSGQAVAGIQLAPAAYRFPFSVKINLADVGGPSAGLMFALAIIDKLTPGSLTGGRFVAGTGEIDPSGTIEAIGGIPQKMAAARAAGATIFLTPAGNCSNIAGAVPAGLRIVKVSTLADAVSALQAIGQGKAVSSC